MLKKTLYLSLFLFLFLSVAKVYAVSPTTTYSLSGSMTASSSTGTVFFVLSATNGTITGSNEASGYINYVSGSFGGNITINTATGSEIISGSGDTISYNGNSITYDATTNSFSNSFSIPISETLTEPATCSDGSTPVSGACSNGAYLTCTTSGYALSSSGVCSETVNSTITLSGSGDNINISGGNSSGSISMIQTQDCPTGYDLISGSCVAASNPGGTSTFECTPDGVNYQACLSGDTVTTTQNGIKGSGTEIVGTGTNTGYISYDANTNTFTNSVNGQLGASLTGSSNQILGDAASDNTGYISLSGSVCSYPAVANPSTAAPYCPVNYTINGADTTCTSDTSNYSCPHGGTLSGTTCTYAATPNITGGYFTGSLIDSKNIVVASGSGNEIVSSSSDWNGTITYNQTANAFTGSINNNWPTANNPLYGTNANTIIGVGGGADNTGTITYNQSTNTFSGKITNITKGYMFGSGNAICLAGGGLSGCIAYTVPTTTYSCPNGGTLSGTTCTYTATATASGTTSPICPSGYTYSNGSCTAVSTVYTCPSGGTLSGTTCTYTATGTSCPNGGGLLPGAFTGEIDGGLLFGSNNEIIGSGKASGEITYSNGVFTGSIDMTNQTSTPAELCPVGETLCSSINNTSPTCPTGSTYDSSTNECLATPSCPSGYVLQSNNTCLETLTTDSTCPTGSTYNSSTNECMTATTATPTCPTGYTYDSSTNSCTASTTASPSACPTGTTLSNGECVALPTCQSGYYYNAALQECTLTNDVTQNACPSGYTYNSSTGQCDSTATTAPDCPTGYTYDSSTGQCTASPTTTTSSTTTYTCPNGSTVASSTDTCTATASCPANYTLSGGACTASAACPTGYTGPNSSGECSASPTCPTGSTVSGSSCTETTTSNPSLSGGGSSSGFSYWGYNMLNCWNGTSYISGCAHQYGSSLISVSASGNTLTFGIYLPNNSESFETVTASGGVTFSGSGLTSNTGPESGWDGETITGVAVTAPNTLTFYYGINNSNSTFTTGSFNITVSGATVSALNPDKGASSEIGSEAVGIYLNNDGAGASVLGVNTLGDQLNFPIGYVANTTSSPSLATFTTSIVFSGETSTTTVSPVCPNGTTVSSLTSTCTASATCPNGSTATSNTCTASPSCPANYTFNSTNDDCEASPTATTTSTTTYTCPDGSTVPSSTSTCTASPTTSCPSGYTYNSSTGQCDSTATAAPTCPTGSSSSGLSNGCYSQTTAPVSCPTGTTFSSSAGECVTAATCPAGYTLTSNQCVSNTSTSPTLCASGYSYDSSTGQCISVTNSTPICPNNYTLQPNGTCTETQQTSPTCSLTGFTYNSSTNQCTSATSLGCQDGQVLQGNQCVTESCPLNGTPQGQAPGQNYTCVEPTGSSNYYCSPYLCYNNTTNTPQPTLETMPAPQTNNAPVTSSGCSGSIYIFPGQALQCTRDFALGENCCSRGKFLAGSRNCSSNSQVIAEAIIYDNQYSPPVPVYSGSGDMNTAPITSCSSSSIANGCGQQGESVYIGNYCSLKLPVVGTCLAQTYVFCKFQGLLATIIQAQGRAQLSGGPDAISWGSAQSPNCTGFTPTQFQELNFANMNLSEYIAVVKNQALKSLNTAQITTQIQNTTTSIGNEVQMIETGTTP